MGEMKAFVITIQDHEYSENKARNCIMSGKRFGVDAENFYGVDKHTGVATMKGCGLEWTWAKNNTGPDICPHTGLQQFPYKDASGNFASIDTKVACSMSHYMLWTRCVQLDEPILILEHDALFLRAVPDVEFNGICQINDPTGATRKGNWWSLQMEHRGEGVFEKTWITSESERLTPDGLAGNSAYMVKPWAAQELIDTFHKIGVWPNDATMCKQIFPYLEEYYPFITKVEQTQSTSIGT